MAGRSFTSVGAALPVDGEVRPELSDVGRYGRMLVRRFVSQALGYREEQPRTR